MEKSDMKALLKELSGIRAALESIVKYITQPFPQIEAVGSLNAESEDEIDELYAAAKKVVVEAGKASTSYLQRKLDIGYARAAKLMDMLEERGVIGPAAGSMPRRVIHRITPEVIATLEQIEKQLKKKKKK